MSVLRVPHIGPHAGIRTPAGAFTGGASPGGFTPATMAGIQGWWDFSTLAGADGSAIASIADGSANGRTASQATGANQPLVKAGANGINGLKVALFDGVNDELQTAAFAVAQPMTVYAVIAGGSPSLSSCYWGSADASLSVRARWDDNIAGPSNFAGSVLSAASAVTTAAAKVLTSVFNGVSSVARVNGVQVVAGDAGTGTVSNGIALGAAVSAQFFAGKYGEVFFTNSATVDTAAEAYLKAKWGTP